jgi:Antidote-toxin recognition MazE, bacterial antitoxin
MRHFAEYQVGFFGFCRNRATTQRSSLQLRTRSMIIEFCKWGNSLAVRIPKALADAVKASDGKRAEIKVENGALVLHPIVKPGT